MNSQRKTLMFIYKNMDIGGIETYLIRLIRKLKETGTLKISIKIIVLIVRIFNKLISWCQALDITRILLVLGYY
jgi:hypothetical protein